MNKYYFNVTIDGGEVKGNIVTEANDSYHGTAKAYDSFCERWNKAFPELEVDFDVELIKVEIDQEEIKRKLEKAREYCPGNEELEIDDCDGEIRACRYSETRGSSEWIDEIDVLWYTDDAELDEDFNPDDVIPGDTLVCM